MADVSKLFENNRAWAAAMLAGDPHFFERLIDAQGPEYLWIGCSDSRVPANEIVGLRRGEVFVHRNVANVVVHTDLNCLSVLQYAVDILRVKHVIVCGHFGCGGVKAALEGSRHGLVDNWLRHVVDVNEKHSTEIESLPKNERLDRLCALNVIEQAMNICQTTIVEDISARGQERPCTASSTGSTTGSSGTSASARRPSIRPIPSGCSPARRVIPRRRSRVSGC